MGTTLPPQLSREWTSVTRTRDGVAITVRPLRPDDDRRETEFVDSLSDEGRYFRMLSPLKHLSSQLLSQFMDVDYDRRMALVACTERDGREKFVGVARYGSTDRPEIAELAVAVSDAWQRRGIATMLISALMRFAHLHGFRSFTGMVLPGNERMLGLARKLKFAITYDATEHLMHISRPLQESQLPAGGPEPQGVIAILSTPSR